MTYNGSANWHTWTIDSVCDNDLYYSKMEFLDSIESVDDITVDSIREFIDECEYSWDVDLSMKEVDWYEIEQGWRDEWRDDHATD